MDNKSRRNLEPGLSVCPSVRLSDFLFHYVTDFRHQSNYTRTYDSSTLSLFIYMCNLTNLKQKNNKLYICVWEAACFEIRMHDYNLLLIFLLLPNAMNKKKKRDRVACIYKIYIKQAKHMWKWICVLCI